MPCESVHKKLPQCSEAYAPLARPTGAIERGAVPVFRVFLGDAHGFTALDDDKCRLFSIRGPFNIRQIACDDILCHGSSFHKVVESAGCPATSGAVAHLHIQHLQPDHITAGLHMGIPPGQLFDADHRSAAIGGERG